MGSLNNGLFGGFHGRVGNLVGYMLNGKSVVRTIGHSSKALTPARKANCQGMTVVNAFLKSNMDFLRTGFRLITRGTDQNFYNAAVSYHKKHAVQGEYPNLSLNYNKALLSMGSLLKADKTEISVQGTGVEFKWEVPDDLSWENRKDRAMLVIYFPDENVSTYVLSGARRNEGKDRIEIPLNLIESRMEAYISFMNEEATEISDSIHAGSLNHNEAKTQEIPESKALTKPLIQPKQKPVLIAPKKKPVQASTSFRWTSSQLDSRATKYSYTFYSPPS